MGQLRLQLVALFTFLQANFPLKMPGMLSFP